MYIQVFSITVYVYARVCVSMSREITIAELSRRTLNSEQLFLQGSGGTVVQKQPLTVHEGMSVAVFQCNLDGKRWPAHDLWFVDPYTKDFHPASIALCSIYILMTPKFTPPTSILPLTVILAFYKATNIFTWMLGLR